MPKTKFDRDAAFKNILGVTTDDQSTDEQQSTEKYELNPIQEISKTTPKQTEQKKPSEKLLQKAYYITEKQYKALKLQAAIGDEKDMSAIVRAALDAYFANNINNYTT